MKNTYNKPPLGVSPSWFVIPNRNKDLADAISRYSLSDYFDRDHLEMIRKWAIEITGNCETALMIVDNK